MSARSQYSDVVLDTSGNALEDISVTVKIAGTNTNATIYSTRAGGGTLTNPIVTTATGLVQFWAPPGSYDLTFHDTTLPARIDDRTITFEAVSGADGGIDGGQLPDGSSAQILITDGSDYTPRSLSGAVGVSTTGAATIPNEYEQDTPTSLPLGGALTAVTGMSVVPGAGTWLVFAKVRIEQNGNALVKVTLHDDDDTIVDLSELNGGGASSGNNVASLVVMSRMTTSTTDAVTVKAGAISGGTANYGRLLLTRVS